MLHAGTIPGKVWHVRIAPGEDLIGGLEHLVNEMGVHQGLITLIGSVKKARLSYYDQVKKEYKDFVIDEPLEIVSGSGNIARRENKPFIHLHAVFSDEKGQCYGGHVSRGTEVFVAEVTVVETQTQPPLERVEDETTGLWLWRA